MYSPTVKTSHNKLDDSLLQSKLILNEYPLCDYCLGRLFAKKLGVSSNKLLGKKIKKRLHIKSSKKCFICKEILSNSDAMVSKMVEKSSDYKFSTFVVGLISKPSMNDRDDLIRSKFKLQGIDSIKTAITKELSKKFTKQTRKKADHLCPDLTFTYNLKDGSCDLQTKSLFLSGRYVKKIRGLPQKQTPCSNCHGKGCTQCNFHGFSKFSSVEGQIAKLLIKKFSGTQMKISWLGGEDKNSLVLGNGRPFFVKLFHPMKRKTKLQKKYILDGIEIHNLKLISKTPKQAIPFRSSIELSIITEKNLTQKNLNPLKSLLKTPIMINEKPKRNEKSIYKIKFKKSSPNSFSLWITVDGGLPIKRFVEGKDIHPNLKELLGTKCECQQFDFHKIDPRNS